MMPPPQSPRDTRRAQSPRDTRRAQSPRDTRRVDTWHRNPLKTKDLNIASGSQQNIHWHVSNTDRVPTVSTPKSTNSEEERRQPDIGGSQPFTPSPQNMMTSFSRDPASEMAPAMEEWSQSVMLSKVDLEMFVMFSEQQLFTQHYLDAIETPVKDVKPIHNKKVPSKSRMDSLIFEFEGKVIRKPPYTFPALIAAAIYMSGKMFLTHEEVVNELCNLFDVFSNDCKVWKKRCRKNINRVLLSPLIKYGNYHGSRTYTIDPHLVRKDMFLIVKKPNGDGILYSHYLFDYLDQPTMYEDLRCNLRRRLVSPSSSAISRSVRPLWSSAANRINSVSEENDETMTPSAKRFQTDDEGMHDTENDSIVFIS